MLQWDLLTGWLPGVLLFAAATAGLVLLASPLWPRWWTVVVPSIVGGAVAASLLFFWLVIHVGLGRPMPGPGAVVWLALMLIAIAVAVAVVVRASWGRKVMSVIAAVVVVLAGLDGIDQSYEYYPTVAQALGVQPHGAVALPPPETASSAAGSGAGSVVPGSAAGSVPGSVGAGSGTTSQGPGGTATGRGDGAATPGDPGPGDTATGGTGAAVSPRPSPRAGASSPEVGTASSDSALAHWRPRGHMPAAGEVSEVSIPGTVSGFAARPGWVYVPPAYLTSNRPDLPLLILIPGEPGGPTDWVSYGRLARIMNAFAAKHHGLAPVVVVPDLTGAHRANTMCVNSALGNAGTYFRTDVINWILANLQVDRDTAHWAIGGFSFGGTCALQYAVDYPTMFPTFLDISGEEAPTLGSAAKSIKEAFGGDKAAYEAIEPLRMLAAASKDPAKAVLWRKLDGTFVVGTADHVYGRQQAVVVAACRKAGMTVHATTYPGKHAWADSYVALPRALPHLAARMGLP